MADRLSLGFQVRAPSKAVGHEKDKGRYFIVDGIGRWTGLHQPSGKPSGEKSFGNGGKAS